MLFRSVLAGAAMCGMIASCGPKSRYTISGSINNVADGDTIFLQEPVGRSLVNLDSTVVKNGKFEFKGTQDSIINAVITWDAKDGAQRVGLYLENGDIKVKFDDDATSVVGTAQNNENQEMKDKVALVQKEREKITEDLKDTTLSETLVSEKTKALDELDKKEISIYYHTIENNTDNLLGVTLFKNIYYTLTLDEKENILSKLSAKYDNEPSIERIRAQVTSEDRKSVV